MTYVDRGECPCVKCDAIGCEEHYMWSAAQPVDLTTRGWLDGADERHYCPTHRVAIERAGRLLEQSHANASAIERRRDRLWMLAKVIAAAVAIAVLLWRGLR